MKLRLPSLIAAVAIAVPGLAACGGGFQCDDVAGDTATATTVLADDCGEDDD